MELKNILVKYWGYSSLRPLQEEIIRSVLEGEDTLALLPTGGGKSISYQVPALAMDGLCLVRLFSLQHIPVNREPILHFQVEHIQSRQMIVQQESRFVAGQLAVKQPLKTVRFHFGKIDQ